MWPETFEGQQLDLLSGGSPCQGFSFAGKQLNFDDPLSKLFFEYVRLLKEAQPRWFLLENVRMKQESQDIISEMLGVGPVAINSSLVSEAAIYPISTTADICAVSTEGIYSVSTANMTAADLWLTAIPSSIETG